MPTPNNKRNTRNSTISAGEKRARSVTAEELDQNKKARVDDEESQVPDIPNPIPITPTMTKLILPNLTQHSQPQHDPSQPIVDNSKAISNTLPDCISPTFRSYFNKRIANRVNGMLCYTEASHRIFAIGMLPPECLLWGHQAGGADDRSRYICNKDTPLTIWVVGEVASVHLYDENKNPSFVSVTITPVLRRDAISAFNVIHSLEHLNPAITLNTTDVDTDPVWFTKWMNSQNNKPVAFTAAYTATSSFKARGLRQPLAPRDIKRNDLVIVESHIQRFRQKDPDSNNKQFIRGWKYWRVHFELISISVLLHAPEDQDVDDSDSASYNF